MKAPGGTWVIFCWVCAAGLSEPLPYFSLFRGQLKTPSLSAFGQDRNGMTTFVRFWARPEWNDNRLLNIKFGNTSFLP